MSVSSTQLSEKAPERTECGAELHLQIAQLQPHNVSFDEETPKTEQWALFRSFALATTQTASDLDETGDLVDSLSPAQIAEDERPGAAHAFGVAFHD
jgi:hypothetical protein